MHDESGVWVVVPHLPENLSQEAASAAQQVLLMVYLHSTRSAGTSAGTIHRWLSLYTPWRTIAWMSCLHSREHHPALRDHEAELFRHGLVFTGGTKPLRARFTSTQTSTHFQQCGRGALPARNITQDPADRTFPIRALGFMES